MVGKIQIEEHLKMLLFISYLEGISLNFTSLMLFVSDFKDLSTRTRVEAKKSQTGLNST